jgi:hypothetical protein
VLVSLGGISRAGDNPEDLRALIEQQGKQIQELKRQLDNVSTQQQVQGTAASDSGKIDDAAVKKIVSDYLKENPGAGMPSGVQTGYLLGQGFTIRSTPDPNYVKWDDDSRIPFELRFRGRIQLDYYRYKVTDTANHVTNTPSTANANATRQADFSQLEVKRMRLVFAGTAFDPDLRYWLELDGNTRGLGGIQNNKVVQTAGGTGASAPNTSPVSPIGGGVTVDHAVRLFSAYVAYDFHGCGSEKGCGQPCPDGTVLYRPTYTAIAGKLKPFMGIEEFLGSGNEQLVEYGMSTWYFDADDDNLLMAAGTQVKAYDDRFFLQAIVTNGNESQFANTQMDDYPGFNVGLWWDFGGSWNEDKKRWNLFGDCLSDIDYSCRPVVRLGGAVNIVPMDRRSLYGDDEQSRVFVMPAGPGGTRLINVLSGDLTASTPPPAGGTSATVGSHAVDDFDSYTYDAFIATKYKGFSLMNEWWLRDLNDFRTSPNGKGNIIYQDTLVGGKAADALFPHHALLDYGTQLQAGYFIVPKKWELVARWSYIRGESGDINGNGTFHTVTIPGVLNQSTGALQPVHVVDGAFRHFHEADEYAVGFNYYFKRQLLKWQTDISWYEGGNPAGGASSPAGFIPGLDGWMLRTQIQLWF